MKKSLDEIYKLLKEDELKKEDLKDVKELFGKDWENDKIEVLSYDKAEEFYRENLDEGLKDNWDYGILYSFWAEIEPTAKDGFKIEFSGGYPCAHRVITGNGEKYALDITDEVKNEFKKMGLDPDKSVDDISLDCALKQATTNLIKKEQIAFLLCHALKRGIETCKKKEIISANTS